MNTFIDRYRTYIGLGLIAVILIGAGVLIWNKRQAGKVAGVNAGSQKIRVDIEGGINKPGVYEIGSEAILEDLIKQAGGFSAQVDQNRVAQEINRARSLGDGEKILIPIMQQAEAASAPVSSGSSSIAGKVN